MNLQSSIQHGHSPSLSATHGTEQARHAQQSLHAVQQHEKQQTQPSALQDAVQLSDAAKSKLAMQMVGQDQDKNQQTAQALPQHKGIKAYQQTASLI